MKISMKHVVMTIAIGVIVGSCFYWHIQNSIAQARFNVDALGRYIHSDGIVNGQKIFGLAGLPDVTLVSYGHNLKFQASDLRSRISRGYFYDLNRVSMKKFVISASPLGPFRPEFGMTDDFNLRINTINVDATTDSYDEVKRWPILAEWFDLQTAGESS